MWSILKIKGSYNIFKLVRTIDCNILHGKCLISNLFRVLSKHPLLSSTYEIVRAPEILTCIDMGILLNIISSEFFIILSFV